MQIGPDQEDVLEDNQHRRPRRAAGRPAHLTVRTDPPAKGTVGVREVDRGEDERASRCAISGALGEADPHLVRRRPGHAQDSWS